MTPHGTYAELPAYKPRSRCGGVRARREARQQSAGTVQKAPPYIVRQIPAFNPYDSTTLECIQQQTDWILAEVGVKFTEDAEMLNIWRGAAGAAPAPQLKQKM